AKSRTGRTAVTRVGAVFRAPLWGLAATLAVARGSPAQTRQCNNARPDTATSRSNWAPPLDRLVSVHGSDVSLRDALDRIAAAAKIRLSYSAELLPLDRAVCLSADAAPVGRVLNELLIGTNVA